MKPEDRRILLDVAECKRLAEAALDRGDVDAFVTPLQALQADARALVSRARALDPRTQVAFFNFLGRLVEVEVARG